MNAQRFSAGARFYWQDDLWQVKRRLPEGRVNIESELTGGIQIVENNKLADALFAGDLEFVVETRRKGATEHAQPLPEEMQNLLSDFSTEQIEKAEFRLQVIKPLLALDSSERTRERVAVHIVHVRTELGRNPSQRHLLRGLSRPSVYRWMRAYVDSGANIRALIDCHANCGAKGRRRLAPDLERLIDNAIDDLVYRRENSTIDDVYHELAVRVQEENRLRLEDDALLLPARSTIARRIDQRDLQERFSARHGSRAAKRSFTQTGKASQPTCPLDQVEIDHTVCDVMVVDGADGLPLGRPTLTMAIDRATRYPLGYYLGFEPPSYYAVMECLYHAIQPKWELMTRYGTQHQWQAYGIPTTLIVDNGKEFIGESLASACEDLGITLVYAPVRTPEYKWGAERMFRTLNTSLFHSVPGTTFSNPEARGDYDSVARAVVTLADLEKMLNTFIVDIYAEKHHRGVHGVPARLWEKAVAAGFNPRLPANVTQINVLLGRVESRTIHHYGIQYRYLRFNHPELARLRYELGVEPARFRFHPGDLSRIFVYFPSDQQYLEVPAVDQEYTSGMSLWKHQRVLEQIRTDATRVDPAALGEAKGRVRDIVDAGRRRTRRTRKQVARFDSSGQPPSRAGEVLAAARAGELEAPLAGNSAPRDDVIDTSDDSEWRWAHLPRRDSGPNDGDRES